MKTGKGLYRCSHCDDCFAETFMSEVEITFVDHNETFVTKEQWCEKCINKAEKAEDIIRVIADTEKEGNKDVSYTFPAIVPNVLDKVMTIKAKSKARKAKNKG